MEWLGLPFRQPSMESMLERLLGRWTLLYQCMQVPSENSLWGCLVCALVMREAIPGEPKGEHKGRRGGARRAEGETDSY